MSFLLKKIFGFLLMPLSVLLVLNLIGIIALWSARRQKTAKIILSATCLLFVLLSYGFLSHWPMEMLEKVYPPLDMNTVGPGTIKRIVVLSGDDQERDIRLIHRITIYRRLPGTKLLVSGGSMFGASTKPDSEIMAKLAKALGVNPPDIVQENKSRDTKDEARIIRSMIGDEPFILVTSAYHMPRSMALFRAQGMHPIPAPTDYHTKDEGYFTPQWFFPSAVHIHDTEIVVHEVLGILSARIMGQL